MSEPLDGGVRVDIGTVGRRARRRSGQFVAVPMLWVERLAAARSAATLKLAMRLLWMHFRDRARPVRLANAVLAATGVSRGQKWRALTELERLGLVRVERRRRRSPIVTLIGAGGTKIMEHGCASNMHIRAP